MKVLIGVRRLDIGGAEMLECRLAVHLNKLGIETHLLAQYSEKEFSGKEKSKEWLEAGVPHVHFLNSGRWGILTALVNLFRLVRNHQYDFVITTNTGLDTIAGMVKIVAPFKQVIAFHTYINPEVLSSLRVKAWLFFVKRAEVYYSITNYVKQNVNLSLGPHSIKNSTVYNSIAPKYFKPLEAKRFSIRQQLGIAEDAQIILLAGRIESRKGFDITVNYLNPLLKQEKIYLVIVGDKYEGGAIESGLLGFSQVLEEEVFKLGLSSKVLYTGYRSDLFEIMQQSNVYVHLARHEGFGLVLLEAIAAEVPIVASDAGGIPEVLKNTPYKAFSLSSETEIIEEVKLFLSLNKEEHLSICTRAKEVLAFYKDERRAWDVLELLNIHNK